MKFLSRVFDESLEDSETYYDNSFVWEYKEKIEFDLALNSSLKVINLDSVDKIKLLIVETDSPINVSLTTTSSSLNIEIEDTFVFTPTESMVNSLTEFLVEETTGLDANVKVRVYGEPGS